MCGIFAYIGNRTDSAQIVLEGLKRLEYRGYDSWGIAVRTSNKIEIEKHTGKIGLATTSLPKSSVGIGHTRWATHGGVTDENSHPHLDCSKTISVVHNGIIENFSELKDDLVKNGHTFLSQTDTEVVAHLIESFSKDNDFITSVRLTFNALRGMNAIVSINSNTNEIVAVKNGSPIVIGVGENEYFLASDATGIIPHTKKVIFLEDNQMIVLTDTVKCYNLPGSTLFEPKIHTLDWEFEETEKGDNDHFFMKEAKEQPHILEAISLNARSESQKLADMISSAHGVFMVACGSAANSGIAGTYFFSRIAKQHVNFAIGSEFTYLENYITPSTLVLAISQSGESIDVIEPMTRAIKVKGAKSAAIVNSLGSTLYRLVDFNLLLNCGPEKSVVATKSFIAMVAVLLLTAYSQAGRQDEGSRLLHEASINVKNLFDASNLANIKNLARSLKDKEHIYALGRGLSYATALEFALKVKETCYVHAEGLPGGELKHGPIALIDKGTPVFVFAPNDETYSDITSNAQEIKARGGFIIGIGPKNNDVFDEWIRTDDIGDATIIPQVVVSQIFAYYLALERGVEDPDKPRNLAKSVTVK